MHAWRDGQAADLLGGIEPSFRSLERRAFVLGGGVGRRGAKCRLADRIDDIFCTCKLGKVESP